jgi:hypothetical protein
MRSLQRRLVAVERQLTPPHAKPQVIEVREGLNDGDPTFAKAGGLRWERAPSEPFAAFRSRVVADATAAAEPFIILGGLPELD